MAEHNILFSIFFRCAFSPSLCLPSLPLLGTLIFSRFSLKFYLKQLRRIVFARCMFSGYCQWSSQSVLWIHMYVKNAIYFVWLSTHIKHCFYSSVSFFILFCAPLNVSHANWFSIRAIYSVLLVVRFACATVNDNANLNDKISNNIN